MQKEDCNPKTIAFTSHIGHGRFAWMADRVSGTLFVNPWLRNVILACWAAAKQLERASSREL
jgi:hypothetical protein